MRLRPQSRRCCHRANWIASAIPGDTAPAVTQGLPRHCPAQAQSLAQAHTLVGKRCQKLRRTVEAGRDGAAGRGPWRVALGRTMSPAAPLNGRCGLPASSHRRRATDRGDHRWRRNPAAASRRDGRAKPPPEPPRPSTRSFARSRRPLRSAGDRRVAARTLLAMGCSIGCKGIRQPFRCRIKSRWRRPSSSRSASAGRGRAAQFGAPAHHAARHGKAEPAT